LLSARRFRGPTGRPGGPLAIGPGINPSGISMEKKEL
jgi:hypothetical protein